MTMNNAQYQIPVGADVYGSDGDKVGKVIAVEGGYVVVEKGFFFPSDYYIPTSAIASFDGNQAYLSMSKDEALNSGWDAAPEMGGTDASYATDATYTDTTMSGAGAYTGTMGAETTTSTTTGQYTDTDRISVPVHEEELVATTREREAGEVVVHKDVVSEQQTLNVPVTEERVRVTRRSVDREAGADETAFTDDTISVPLRTEEVELEKRVRVAEEIDIEKEAVQRTEQVSDTVRREVVEVEDGTMVSGSEQHLHDSEGHR